MHKPSKFEYKTETVDIDHVNVTKVLNKALSKFAKEGWDLVSVDFINARSVNGIIRDSIILPHYRLFLRRRIYHEEGGDIT